MVLWTPPPPPPSGRVGLGRLAYELLKAGYRVEANECSQAFVTGLFHLLNHNRAQFEVPLLCARTRVFAGSNTPPGSTGADHSEPAATEGTIRTKSWPQPS